MVKESQMNPFWGWFGEENEIPPPKEGISYFLTCGSRSFNFLSFLFFLSFIFFLFFFLPTGKFFICTVHDSNFSLLVTILDRKRFLATCQHWYRSVANNAESGQHGHNVLTVGPRSWLAVSRWIAQAQRRLDFTLPPLLRGANLSSVEKCLESVPGRTGF